MQSIGRGVFELRQADTNGWYRIVYMQRIAGRLFMLHSFVKKSAKTSQRDLNIAKQRLKGVRERLAKEKKDAKD
jgi:phage-related protein